jgi:hypothetical protein
MILKTVDRRLPRFLVVSMSAALFDHLFQANRTTNNVGEYLYKYRKEYFE